MSTEIVEEVEPGWARADGEEGVETRVMKRIGIEVAFERQAQRELLETEPPNEWMP